MIDFAASRLLIEKTLLAFETGGAAPATLRDALDGLDVLAACYRSADNGSRIQLDASRLDDRARVKMGEPA